MHFLRVSSNTLILDESGPFATRQHPSIDMNRERPRRLLTAPRVQQSFTPLRRACCVLRDVTSTPDFTDMKPASRKTSSPPCNLHAPNDHHSRSTV